MKKLEQQLNMLAWQAYFKAMTLKDKAQNALKNEDGDTNFLSIIIILAIVLVVAVIFIALKDKILLLVQKAWDDFSKAFSGQKTEL